MRIPDRIAKNAKAFLAGLGVLSTLGTEALADDVLSLDEGLVLGSVALNLAGAVWAVWRTRNRVVADES